MEDSDNEQENQGEKRNTISSTRKNEYDSDSDME